MIFNVTLTYETENNFSKEELKELLYEQWEQTPAYDEGDKIEIKSID